MESASAWCDSEGPMYETLTIGETSRYFFFFFSLSLFFFFFSYPFSLSDVSPFPKERKCMFDFISQKNIIVVRSNLFLVLIMALFPLLFLLWMLILHFLQILDGEMFVFSFFFFLFFFFFHF